MRRDNQPYAFRRHARKCQFFGRGGREVRSDKCRCPFHVDGIYHGRRIRQSLGVRDRQKADRKLTNLLQSLDAQGKREGAGVRRIPTVAEAAGRFLQSRGEVGADGKYEGDVKFSTWRKYRTKLNLLVGFCQGRRVNLLEELTFDVLAAYRNSRRGTADVTWKVELQALRTFFSYCISRRWIADNPAKELKSPRNVKPKDVVPYTPAEEARILAACDYIGGGKYHRSGAKYEQIRARAMILVLQHTALRISDVATLRRDAVTRDEEKSTWRIYLRTLKTDDPVFLPIPAFVKLALDRVPLPREAERDCPYFFWNGRTEHRAVVGIAERTLASVFEESGVKNAGAHRFRHTLATRLLARGVSVERVADILGNSAPIVRKHYAKWSKEHQDAIDAAIMDYHATIAATAPVTFQSHEKTGAVS